MMTPEEGCDRRRECIRFRTAIGMKLAGVKLADMNLAEMNLADMKLTDLR
jgi:hypothetical protein